MEILNTPSIKKSYQDIRKKSLGDIDYYLLLILSSIICFFGIRMNSAAVIIGAMVISPLLYSVFGLSTSIFFKDIKQFIKEVRSLSIEFLLILAVIFVFGSIFKVEISSEITSRLSGSNIDYFFVAFFSGIAGTFSLFWPKVQKSLVGVAISVALIPPIVICGIGLANFDVTIIGSFAKIVLINFVGISIGSLLLLILFKNKKHFE